LATCHRIEPLTFLVPAAAAAAAVWELFTAASAFKGHFGNVVQRVVAGERPPVPEGAPEEYKLLMTSWWVRCSCLALSCDGTVCGCLFALLWLWVR
jgi:hypothetical protein